MTTRVPDSMEITPPAFHYSGTATPLAITANLLAQYAHGLSAAPTLLYANLVCQTAELGYSIGDQVALPVQTATGGGIIWANANNIGISLIGSPAIPNKSTGTVTTITLANWKLVLSSFL